MAPGWPCSSLVSSSLSRFWGAFHTEQRRLSSSVRPRVVQDPSDNGEPTEEQADGQPQEGGEQGDQPQDGSGGPQQGELQVGLASQEQQQGQQQQLSE